jgi:uncharacterized membrane protein YccC
LSHNISGATFHDSIIDGVFFTLGGFSLILFTYIYSLFANSEHFLQLQQAYWVPLTSMLVIKLDNSFTWMRLQERFKGTLLGGVFSVMIVSLIHDKLLLALLLFPLTFLMITALAKHYATYAGFLTAMIVISFEIISPHGLLVTEERILNTAIGVVIVAIVSCFGSMMHPKTCYLYIIKTFNLVM